MPPPMRAGPQVFASPLPRPPTTIGYVAGAGPPRPPPPPPGPWGGAPAEPLPVAPQPCVSGVIHLRLRYFTVSLFTSFSELYRFPVRSPEKLVHSSESGFMIRA